MKFALVMLLGFALVVLLPGKTAIIAAAGVIAGFIYLLAEAKWPRPKATYIDPVNRPKARTSTHGYAAAAAMGIGGVALALFAWKVMMTRSPLMGIYGVYLAMVCAGSALGMMLTVRRTRDAHNAWLSSMTPAEPLEF